MRKTKSGEALCNIRPLVLEAVQEGDKLHLVLEATPAGTLKPGLLVKCLCEMAGAEEFPFLAIREEILCRDKAGKLLPMEEYTHG
jgi:hypothetical protein